jgi:hypothetical protein
MSARWWFWRVTSWVRHGSQCRACDRRVLCHILKAGSRPCDRGASA